MKDGIQSTGFWGAVILLLNTSLTASGNNPLPDDTAINIVNLIGGALALWGRFNTTIKPIASVFGVKLPWVKS